MKGAHWALLGLAALLLWPRKGGASALQRQDGPVTKGPRAGQSEDVEALARLLASEASSKPEVWPAIARAAENVARARGVTIPFLLRTEVTQDVTSHSDAWGPQWNPLTGAKRWASTRQPATAASTAFAGRYLSGELTADEAAVRGAAAGATSFLEAKAGSALATAREKEWKKPLLYEARGWRFYG